MPEEAANQFALWGSAEQIATQVIEVLAAVALFALGVWLWMGWGVSGGWLHAKLMLVLLVVGYHHACRSLLRRFENFTNQRSERWFRVFNEVSVVLFVAIVVLVVVKPF